jgi:hypothetical protein
MKTTICLRPLCLLFVLTLFSIVHPVAFGQKRCSVAVSDSEFEQYKGAIKAESFSDNQMEVAKQVPLCLSTTQIKAVMAIFSFEESKLSFAKFAYSNCVDAKNYYLINSALTYSASKTELNQFVKGQPAPKEEEPTIPKDNIPTQTTDAEPVVVPPKNTTPPRKTGWEPKTTPKTVPANSSDPNYDAYIKAQQQMQSFFVMTLGMGDNQIDQSSDVHKPEEDPSTLPAKAPRVVITAPELNQENNFTARTTQKKLTVSGVISSSVGIYEVFINDTEAILNQKGEFFGDVFLSPGENQISIKAKDTKGQNAKIGFKVVRESGQTNPDTPPKETVKEEPVAPVVPPPVTPPAVFVSEIDKDIPKLGKTNKDAIAVVIGNQRYSKAKSVEYAENDARSMKAYLINMLGFKEGNILYYENASLSDFNTVFGTSENPKGRLYNTIKQGVSDVIIYYSGHGAPGLKNSKAYFVPVEADPNYMENGGYSIDVLYQNLKKLPAKTITLFSDACFSGADVFDKISPMVIRAKEPVKEGMKNTTLISSCTGTEVSCWHTEERHGLFTFYLLQALKNYKETDLNKDKQVSLDEVFKSLADNNEGVPYFARRQFGLNQTPVIQGPKTRILFKY